jgi:tetratricopeptide (TPR) repeat protein
MRTAVLVATIAVALWAPAAGSSEEKAATHARADELLLGGDAALASEIYAELAASDALDIGSRVGRIRSLLALDRWREALDEATRFAEALPDSPEIATTLGEALLRAGHFEQVDEILSPIVAKIASPDREGTSDATLARALIALGRLRDAEGRAPIAAEYLNRALELAPDDRYVIYESAGAAATREEIVARLERYLSLSEGDDPDHIEAARGKIRFYGMLGERRVWVVETRPDRIEVPLIPIGDGAGGLIGYAVDVKIGSKKPVRLLLDTGSTGLFLLQRIAKKRGFTPIAEETVFGGGGKKRHVSPRGLFPSVKIDDLAFKDALATTTGREIDRTGRFHGLLGLSIFAGYRVVLDLEENLLTLDRSSDPSDEGSPYWAVSGQMLVRAATSVGGGGLFLFDTGATSTTVSLDLARHSPGATLGQRLDVQGFGGSLESAREIHGLAVEFHGLETPGPTINGADLSVRSRLGRVEISGFIGLDLLAGRRIVVDTRTRRVEVSTPERPKRKGGKGR